MNYIKNISDSFVKQNGWGIAYVNEPSDELQELAVQQNGYGHILKGFEDVQRIAVQQNADVIKHIDNPSKEAISIAALMGCNK